MSKTDSLVFFGALQRLMKRHKIDSIEAQHDRVVFFDEYGRKACSFEGLDLGKPDESLNDCVREPGYESIA